MKHTPGPWLYNRNADESIWILNSHREHFASVEIYGCEQTMIPQAEADARLICAAPDLLEACRVVKRWFATLEDNLPEDDPLRAMRKKFHAPVHKILDSAISRAETGVS